jgi:hypothetical protein
MNRVVRNDKETRHENQTATHQRNPPRRAVIWGMPAVNYDLMLQEMFNKAQGKTNEILY